MSKFLISLAVHEYIWYFSRKIWKSQIWLQAMKDKKKEGAAKFFDKLQHPFNLAKSSGAADYTTSAEAYYSSNECPDMTLDNLMVKFQ